MSDKQTEPVIDEKLAQETFQKLLAGETITEEVKTARGSFTLKYPLGRDFVEIDRRKALMRGGVPAEQFDRQADANIEAFASLDVCVIEAPDWWKKLQSSMDCPDPALIDELYRGYLRLVRQVRQVLQVRSAGATTEQSPSENQAPAVGRGLFPRFTWRGKAGKAQ
jgi:hypothetical protein